MQEEKWLKRVACGVALLGLVLTAAAPVLAQCLEPPCATTPCHNCTNCTYQSSCYSPGSKITYGSCPGHGGTLTCSCGGSNCCNWSSGSC